MIFSLHNKTAVVTGGASGIGLAISTLFHSQGAYVHMIDVSTEAGSAALATFSNEQQRIQFHSCDISSQQEVRDLFSKIAPIDILVNNAGIAHIGKADTTSEQDFERIVNVNIKGVYNCLHCAIPLMKEKGGGVILNMASVAALVGLQDRFVYSASKGAVISMTMSVAKDYIADNIRCNSISPARVHTPFVDGFLKKNYPGREEEMFNRLSKSQPIGRMASPQEIAYLALYLCSDEASFITGCDYPIDGGFVKLNN
jgi:2-keto-3-deoxy-L-fuconate dehydrogenase